MNTLTADSTGIEFNQQETAKATKTSRKDADQVKIKAFKNKISELEYQIQTRESIIKNLSLANERLLQEKSDLRRKFKFKFNSFISQIQQYTIFYIYNFQNDK